MVTVITDSPGMDPQSFSELHRRESLLPNCRVETCSRDCGYFYAAAANAHQDFGHFDGLAIRWGAGSQYQLNISNDYTAWLFILILALSFIYTIVSLLSNLHAIKSCFKFASKVVQTTVGGATSSLFYIPSTLNLWASAYTKSNMDDEYLKTRDKYMRHDERVKFARAEKLRTEERNKKHEAEIEKLKSHHIIEMTGTPFSVRASLNEAALKEDFQREKITLTRKYKTTITALISERDTFKRLAETRGERIDDLRLHNIEETMDENFKLGLELSRLKVAPLKDTSFARSASVEARSFERAPLQHTQHDVPAPNHKECKRLLDTANAEKAKVEHCQALLQKRASDHNEEMTRLSEDLDKIQKEHDEITRLYTKLRQNQPKDRSAEVQELQLKIKQLQEDLQSRLETERKLQLRLEQLTDNIRAQADKEKELQRQIEQLKGNFHDQLQIETDKVRREADDEHTRRTSSLKEQYERQIRDLNTNHTNEMVNRQQEIVDKDKQIEQLKHDETVFEREFLKHEEEEAKLKEQIAQLKEDSAQFAQIYENALTTDADGQQLTETQQLYALRKQHVIHKEQISSLERDVERLEEQLKVNVKSARDNALTAVKDVKEKAKKELEETMAEEKERNNKGQASQGSYYQKKMKVCTDEIKELKEELAKLKGDDMDAEADP